MQIKNLLITSYGDTNINIAQRLFSLNFKPEQLFITTLSSKNNKGFLEFCKTYGIKHQIIDNIQDIINIVNASKFDVGICVGGLPFLVPDTVLDQISHGIINLHTSDSNKYRGRWMAPWTILNGDKEYGYTWHYMNQEFDMGNILLQEFFPIKQPDTAFSVNHNIMINAIFKLSSVLELVGQPGNAVSSKGHYYNNSVPHNGVIDPTWSDKYIQRFIKAMYHPPYMPAGLVDNHGNMLEIKDYDEYQAFQKTCR
jgi:methionyl-tRNA formyltransferase